MDDPIECNCLRKEIGCLLLGSMDHVPGMTRPTTLRNLKATSKKSWLGSEDSDSLEILVGALKRSAELITDREKEDPLNEKFEPPGGDGIRFSFYLVIAPSSPTDQPPKSRERVTIRGNSRPLNISTLVVVLRSKRPFLAYR